MTGSNPVGPSSNLGVLAERFLTMIVSFDYDDTLCEFAPSAWGIFAPSAMPNAITKYLDLLQEYHALGCRCIILTARCPEDGSRSEINRFLRHFGVQHCVQDIVFTSHQPKGPFAKELGVKLHYDDSQMHLDSVRKHGIKAICTKATMTQPNL